MKLKLPLPFLMLMLCMLLFCLLMLPSCAGWEFQVRGPYGSATSVDDKIVITPLPIVVPSGK